MAVDDFEDFDAATDEVEAATIPIKVCGQMWNVPASPPALAMLKVRRIYMEVSDFEIRMLRGKITEADAEKAVAMGQGAEVVDLLALLVGQELVDAWLNAGITDAKIKAVFQSLWRRYNGISAAKAPEEDSSDPKAEEPQDRTSSSPSSESGPSLRPISGESTGSTSRAS